MRIFFDRGMHYTQLSFNLFNIKETIQVRSLIENIEQNMFWTSEDTHLHRLKQELLSQIDHLPINISACGFFNINRQFLGRVSS